MVSKVPCDSVSSSVPDEVFSFLLLGVCVTEGCEQQETSSLWD